MPTIPIYKLFSKLLKFVSNGTIIKQTWPHQHILLNFLTHQRKKPGFCHTTCWHFDQHSMTELFNVEDVVFYRQMRAQTTKTTEECEGTVIAKVEGENIRPKKEKEEP